MDRDTLWFRRRVCVCVTTLGADASRERCEGLVALGGSAHKAAGSGGRGGKGSGPLGAASYAEARPASPQFTSTN